MRPPFIRDVHRLGRGIAAACRPDYGPYIGRVGVLRQEEKTVSFDPRRTSRMMILFASTLVAVRLFFLVQW